MMSEMQLLAVFAVLAAVAVSGALSSVELFCGCRVGHQQDWNIALHCTREKGGSSQVSCQKNRVPEIPRGYHYVPGYALIRLSRVSMPWAEAKKICENEGAQLAVPRDRSEFDGLRQIFPKERGIWYAYVGITDQVSEGVYVGVDGRPTPYLPWQPNHNDDGDGFNEDCLDVRNDGLLNDVNCGFPSAFFCERRLSVVVPEGYTWSGDAGRFYKVHKEKKAYAEAAQACRSENATLAVTDTWQRAVEVLRLVETNTKPYLVGFTDEDVEGDFVTETGRHLADMEFQVWGVNQPDNNSKGRPENCLIISGKGRYNDLPCDSAQAFICEIVP